MNRWLPRAVIALLFVVTAVPASADVYTFTLHDHPDGESVPPIHGLRLDGLIQANEVYTFSFDYVDDMEMAEMTLEFREGIGEIRIFGRAYGGREIGDVWDPAESGWIDIDFTYRNNVIRADYIDGAPGDDIYVLDAHPNNNGTITLDGWGGDQVFNFMDKTANYYSFSFDSDHDTKGNQAIASDPTTWSGAGWLDGPGHPYRDWLFLGQLDMAVPTTSGSVGQMKANY